MSNMSEEKEKRIEALEKEFRRRIEAIPDVKPEPGHIRLSSAQNEYNIAWEWFKAEARKIEEEFDGQK